LKDGLVPNEKDAVISIRMPKGLKAAIFSLANIAGVPVSEFARMVWERDINSSAEEGERIIAFARAISEERHGAEQAKRLERHEYHRLQMIIDGTAVDDGNGGLKRVEQEEAHEGATESRVPAGR